MFDNTSRYHGLPIATWTDERGYAHRWVRLRVTTPPTSTTPYRVQQNERFDLLSNRAYGEPTQWWRIPDANIGVATGLAQDLLAEPGATIALGLPVRPEVTPQ